MKKIISTVAALGLVVGVAGTASAMDFSMTGQYVVEGYMLSGADGNDAAGTFYDDAGDLVDDWAAAGDITAAQALYLHEALDTAEELAPEANGGVNVYDDEAGTDSAWLHTFIVKPQLKVNDKITMFSELRFARYNVWGTNNNGGAAGDSDLTSGEQNIDVYTLYMEYLSPVGKVRLGRCIVPPWGGDFMSSYGHADRLMWWPSFVADPFSLLVFTQKSVENDWYDDATDSDEDVYEIDLTYKTDKLLLLGGYNFFNNKTRSDTGDPTTSYDRQNHRLRAYAVANLDPFKIEAEWGWRFGDWNDYDDNTVFDDIDVDAMAFMIDASMKMDKLDAGLLYFWAEGQDDSDDVTAAMAGTVEGGIGDDFNPYYILTGDLTGMLNSDVNNADPLMVLGGVHSIGVHSDFQVSDQLTLHGAIGYAWADSTDVLEYVIDDIDDEYGWEIDLGAKYKLLDNLTYEVRAAYFNTGDFFDDVATAVGMDSDDVYLLSHHLTMTF